VLNGNIVPNEIIIIDDGSFDDTSKIVDEFDVSYFYIPNGGVSKARNFGILKSKYEWISFLDSDDLWEANKLENQISFHKKHQDILISQSQERWIRNGNDVLLPKKYKKYSGDIFTQAIKECVVSMSSLMAHKTVFQDIGNFDESLMVCEDYDLTLRIARKYNFGLIHSKDITKYGGHNNQLSRTYKSMDIQRIESLIKHLDNHENIDLVINEIKKKSLILYTGAKKYGNTAIYEKYKNLFNIYNKSELNKFH